jgi:hypothetical protein
LAAADFNRDGIPDLAVAVTGEGAVVVLDGRGHGRYGAPRKIGRAGHPFLLTGTDLNADAIPDIAVAEEDSGVALFLADGRGGFKKRRYPTGKWSSDVAAADFNEDRVLDLAVTNWGSNDVSILRGKNDGTFQRAQSITYEDSTWSTATAPVRSPVTHLSPPAVACGMPTRRISTAMAGSTWSPPTPRTTTSRFC